jgi:hypothetical protein
MRAYGLVLALLFGMSSRARAVGRGALCSFFAHMGFFLFCFVFAFFVCLTVVSACRFRFVVWVFDNFSVVFH